MPRFRAMRVELLFQKFPELEAEVDQFLEARFGAPGYNRDLGALIESKTGERLPSSTLSHWVQRRYWQRSWPQRKREIAEQKKAYAAMAELVGETGLDHAAAARLWEAVQTMTPEQLLGLRAQQLAHVKLQLQTEQVENQRRALELKIEQQLQAVEQAKKQIAGVVGDEKASAEDVRRKIREIYGIVEESGARSQESEGAGREPGTGPEASGSQQGTGNREQDGNRQSPRTRGPLGNRQSSPGDGAAPAVSGEVGS